MTNRRRSGKGRATVSKKSESPDKHTKKLTRRGRRSRKSESPEQPENAGSECSGEEIEDSQNKGVDGDEESDSCRESSQFDINKSNDDAKSQSKEEESGGSDGSWKVKSENGGGGGIPKLKLCLTRPPEMPSPTSEQNPSPRRRRRSGRGNATPTKEDQIEENTVAVEESSKRVTRNQKIRELQIEAAEKEAEQEVKEDDAKEDFSPTNMSYNAEEDETRLAVESICGTVQNDDNQMTMVETIHEVTESKEVKDEKIPEPSLEQNFEAPLEEIPIPSVEKHVEKAVQEKQHAEETVQEKPHVEEAVQEKPHVEEAVQEKPHVEEAVQEKQQVGKAVQEKQHVGEPVRQKQVEEPVQQKKRVAEPVQQTQQIEEPVQKKQDTEPLQKKQDTEPVQKKQDTEPVQKKQDTEPVQKKQDIKSVQQKEVEKKETLKLEAQPLEAPSREEEKTANEAEKQPLVKEKPLSIKPEPEPEHEMETEPVLEIMERRRSSSRDSSEERAKEAALRSRNKNKRKEGSEEGEVIESPGGDLARQTESQNKSKKSIVSAPSGRDGKENIEEHAPAKSGARKRRWGSSTSRTNKKPSVSISTDFLKEIIPEAKPLLMSEVQLSPNEEDEEGQLKDSEESLPIATKKVEREKVMQSDESEKDYEEEAVESGMEEPAQTEVTKPAIQVKEKEFTTFTRKVSVMPSNDRIQKSPSPPRNKPSNILYIVNLVRPFTIPQLRELLARTGTIVEDGFWIDKIKSKCYVKYESEEQAKTTRHALHGVRWPVSNPKQLSVDFGTESAMKAAMEGNEVPSKRPIPSLFDKQIDLKTSEKVREREKERERERERDRDRSGERRERSDKDKKERSKHREDEKRDEGEEEKDKKSRPPVEPLVRDRTVRRVTMPIREWDVGKNEDGFSPPPDGMEFSRHRDDRYERRVEYDKDKRDDNDDRRRRDRDRSRRSVSGEPPRKSKKKTEEEAPAKLLDDLFRKTKATPCIYWLPLTPEQIAVKEEMRRKHMAEHEKKVAELKKMQREQNKRSSDKRRRRTRSRSRSRSAKK